MLERVSRTAAWKGTMVPLGTSWAIQACTSVDLCTISETTQTLCRPAHQHKCMISSASYLALGHELDGHLNVDQHSSRGFHKLLVPRHPC